MKDMKEKLSKFQGLLVLLILFILSSFLSSSFLKPSNLANVMRQISENGIIAIGMTFVILAGGIDLSVGSLLAFTNCLTAGLIMHSGFGTLPTIVLCLGAGVLLGGVNGLIITKGRIQPFVVTLAMMSIARGLAYLYAKGRPIVVTFGEKGAPKTFDIIGSDIGIIPVPAIVFVIIVLIAYFILKKLRFGRYVYAIGGNLEASRLSGINVDRCIIATYCISGILAAIGGLIHTSMLHMGHPAEGTGYELNAIAAVVIGGTSLSGGIGGVGGTFLGALIIGILNNILGLRNVNPYVQMLLKGVIIIGAVLLQRRKGSRRN